MHGEIPTSLNHFLIYVKIVDFFVKEDFIYDMDNKRVKAFNSIVDPEDLI